MPRPAHHVAATALTALALACTPAHALVQSSSQPFVGVTYHRYVQAKGDPVRPFIPREVVADILEIDLTAPGIVFLMQPGNGSLPGEVTRMRTSEFVDSVGAQMGINIGFYDTSVSYPTQNGQSFTDLTYISASQGDVYSPAAGGEPFFNITADNVPSIRTSSGPGATTGLNNFQPYNAAGGNIRILRSGTLLNTTLDYATTLNPHTAIGISQDQTRVFLMTVDGRQTNYSEGMYSWEMAQILKDYGAWDVVNMDGGGSTTMVLDDSNDNARNARVVNSPSDGSERKVGSSLAVFAQYNASSLTWLGGGTWTTSGSTWFDGVTARVWLPGAKAVFSGSGGTVSLGSGVSANGGLQFAATGYTLSGTGLRLGGTSNTVEVAGAATATIAAALSGTTGLAKTGSGTLVLGAANTLTGTTNVNRGTLRVTHGGALQSSPIVVQTGGTLALPTASRLVLSATSLTVDQATGGTIDIGRGRIDIAAGATEANLRADLIAGRASGSFSGTSGIMTTGGATGAATTAVVGYRVFASGSAIVAWAANGDANLDGQVNFTDISLVNNGGKFGQGSSTGATWAQGDFNYSGGVTFTDISLLNNSGLYGAGSYLPAAGLGSFGDGGVSMTAAPDGGPLVLATVPEPGAGLLAAVGLALAALAATRRVPS